MKQQAAYPRAGTRAWIDAERKRFVKQSLAIGGFVSPALAAKIMGVSRQRIDQQMHQSCNTSLKYQIFFNKKFIPCAVFDDIDKSQ